MKTNNNNNKQITVQFEEVLISPTNGLSKRYYDTPVTIGTKEIYVGATGNWKYKWKHIHSIDEENCSQTDFLFETDVVRVELINGTTDASSLGAKNKTTMNWMDFVDKRWNYIIEKRGKKNKKNVVNNRVPVQRRSYATNKKKREKPRKIYGSKSNTSNYVQPTLAELEWSDQDEVEEEEDTPPMLREENIISNKEDNNNNVIVIDDDDDDDDEDKKNNQTKDDHTSSAIKDTIVPKSSSYKKNRIEKKKYDEEDSDNDMFLQKNNEITTLASNQKVVSPNAKDVDFESSDEEDNDNTKSKSRTAAFFAPRVSKTTTTKRTNLISEKLKQRTLLRTTEPSTPLKQNNQHWIESRPSSQQKITPVKLSSPSYFDKEKLYTKNSDISTEEDNKRPKTKTSLNLLDHFATSAKSPQKTEEIEDYSSDEKENRDDDEYQKHNGKRRKFKQLNSSPRPNNLYITTNVADRALALNTTPVACNKRHKLLSSTKQKPWMNDDIEEDIIIIKKWKGLKNLGNTCYLNSSLQLLYTLPEFVSGLTGRDSTLCESILSVSRSLIDTKSDITKSTIHQSSVNPRCIKEAVDSVTNRFLGNEQRDAHEFLSDLIDRLHDELKDKEEKNDGNEKLVTDQFFRTDMKVCLRCNSCGYERTKQEMYRHLSIEVDRHDNYNRKEEEEIRKWKVEDGLKKFFDPQRLDVTCEKCKEGTTATQTLSIASFPKALILQLKRFVVQERKTDKGSVEMIISKNKDPVLVPSKINLGDMVTAQSDNINGEKQQQNVHYKLAGIVHHHGMTPSSGHYTADVIRDKNEWISFDDWRTSTTELDRLLEDPTNQRTSYMLLYTLQE